jgi:superfamily II DNA or RNA helicase
MKLRSYQVKLNKPVLKFLKSKIGQRAQIYAPTGSGKTVCFNELIKDAILRGKTNICILHPRIALSKDQLRRFKNEFGTSVTTSSFHCGGHVVGAEKISEIATIDKNKLLKVISQTKSLVSKPHITFSSYHSFHQLVDVHFDIIICDEAHYMVQEQFFSWINNMTADKILFYTATPITDEMEGGMRDYSVFGNVIASVEPTLLIKGGYIVAPLIHEMECRTNKRGKEVDVVDIVARAYVSQYEEITKHGMPFHQMLVAARNVEVDIREIESNLVTLWTKIQQLSAGRIIGQVAVYTVEAGGAYKNGKPLVSREAALKEIKESGSNCIVAHFDTLSEGIDIDTLTGAVLMRKMSKAKIIQTIGRCARPYVLDLDPVTKEPSKKLYNPKKGIDLRKKPRCVITLPVIDGVWIANNDGTIIAEAFISAGYKELMTYMPIADEEPSGKSRREFNLGDEDTVRSAVLNHKVERKIADLKKLFEDIG